MHPFHHPGINDQLKKKEEPNRAFIQQTADDYGMEYEDVLYIYRFHNESFYEELEKFISFRSKENQ